MNQVVDQKLRIRPRFKEEIQIEPTQIKEKMKAALSKNKASCHGKIVQNHVILSIPPDQQHYWSPQLSLEFEEKDSGTIIRGLYGPKPAVWTMFVFFYSAIGFFTLMGLIFGLSQMMLKMNPYALWSVPLGGFLILGLFIISKIGQGLSQNQMHQLKAFIDEALNHDQESLDL